MAYETKAILIAVAEFLKETGSIEKTYALIAKMANTEGVVVRPFLKDEDKT